MQISCPDSTLASLSATSSIRHQKLSQKSEEHSLGFCCTHFLMLCACVSRVGGIVCVPVQACMCLCMQVYTCIFCTFGWCLCMYVWIVQISAIWLWYCLHFIPLLQGHVGAAAHAGCDEGARRVLCPLPRTDAGDAAQFLCQWGQHDCYVICSEESVRARPSWQ